jgi:hypothetical protein
MIKKVSSVSVLLLVAEMAKLLARDVILSFGTLCKERCRSSCQNIICTKRYVRCKLRSFTSPDYQVLYVLRSLGLTSLSQAGGSRLDLRSTQLERHVRITGECQRADRKTSLKIRRHRPGNSLDVMMRF